MDDFDKDFRKTAWWSSDSRKAARGRANEVILEKLGLSDIDQIYTLTEAQIAECLSSEKIAEKLYAEILNSISAPLNLVLPAFSIPLIGKTATDKLSKVCKNITDISDETCEKAGLGPKATESLLNWLDKEFYCFYDGMLPFSFEFEQMEQMEQKGSKGVVCISGKLKSFKTKAEATKALDSVGYEVKSSLTKQVTILVNESGLESSKTKQARDSGVTIVTNLLDLLEN